MSSAREYLNTLCKDEHGASPNVVYRSGIEPLRESQRIKARKDGFEGGWSYRLEGTE